jgi:hypothetical protein
MAKPWRLVEVEDAVRVRGGLYGRWRIEVQSPGTACKGVITMVGSHERPRLGLLET